MPKHKSSAINWKYVIPVDNPNRYEKLLKRVGYAKAVILLQERSMTGRRTKHEKIFRQWLEEAGEIFEDQIPVWGKYILDFLLPTRRLIVELDGLHHYATAAMDYDDARTSDLRTIANVLRIPNALICDEHKEATMQMIRQHVEYNAV